VGDAAGESPAERHANRGIILGLLLAAEARETTAEGLYRPDDLAKTLHTTSQAQVPERARATR